MIRDDIKVEITCDGEVCNKWVEIFAPKFQTFSEVYDCRKETINSLIEEEGWVVSVNGEDHFCPACADAIALQIPASNVIRFPALMIREGREVKAA